MQNMAEPLPVLTGFAADAAECWRWCGGWHPERWPVFAALHEVGDWGAAAELMLGIRLLHEQEQETQRTGTAERAT